jgi:hypothetical protein
MPPTVPSAALCEQIELIAALIGTLSSWRSVKDPVCAGAVESVTLVPLTAVTCAKRSCAAPPERIAVPKSSSVPNECPKSR